MRGLQGKRCFVKKILERAVCRMSPLLLPLFLLLPLVPICFHINLYLVIFAGAMHTSEARFANSATEPTPARFSRTRLYPKAEIGSKELTNRKDISIRQQFNSV